MGWTGGRVQDACRYQRGLFESKEMSYRTAPLAVCAAHWSPRCEKRTGQESR